MTDRPELERREATERAEITPGSVAPERPVFPAEEAPPPAEQAPRRSGVRIGLSFKLLVLTILFVMLGEVLIYVPSIANYRLTWLRDRLNTAEVAALALTAPDGNRPSEDVRDQLLRTVGAKAIVVRDDGIARLIALADMPPSVDRQTNLMNIGPLASIAEAFDTLFAGSDRILRAVDEGRGGSIMEIIIAEAPLRAAMLRYSANILALSLLISIITASLVYLSLSGLLVRPMRRITSSMIRFREEPEDASRVIVPSGRQDEIGLAEESLAEMQRQLAGTLAEKRHLADLGLAVAKINHDLRNLLASAQLISDRLSAIPDPTVQRFAPKLIAALDRAIAYCQSTITYGRARELPPERRLLALRRLVDEAAETLGLLEHPTITFENRVEAGIEIDADPDQLLRVLINLGRNAVQALEADSDPALVRRLTVSAEREGSVTRIRVSDTGPGVPAKARQYLFRAFEGSARPGGTGLGLAIAAELVRAHGGGIRLIDESPGAHFEIEIPDRPIRLDSARRANAQGV